MTIIGLTGLAGSGKSTAAEYLVREHGFIRQGFAWPLKKMLRTLDPIIGRDGRTLATVLEQYDGNENSIKLWFPEYRRLLQVLGTDCIRAVDPDFWVKAAMKDLDPEKDYVFDDVRFPNEASAIYLVEGGVLANVYRPGLQRGEHESERYAGLMGESFTIGNYDGVDELHHELDRVLQGFKVPAL